MSYNLQEEILGEIQSLGSSIALPNTYTINIFVKNAYLDGSQEWSNLYQQPTGSKYILDAHYGRIGAGNWPSPQGRLDLSASSGLLIADQWHMVTARYDGTDMKYYVNGQPIGTVLASAGNWNAPNSIDVLNGPAGQRFAEKVKDLRLYEGVATDQEILSSYNAGGVITQEPPTPVAHWSFDNGNANDDIGNADGVNSGALLQSIDNRTVVSFDGVNDYIQIPDPAVLSGNTWTISHWIKTSATSGRQDYFSKWYSSNGNYPSVAMGIDNGVLKAYYRGDNKGSINSLTGPSIADSSWHHIAYVKDASEVRIYVDGSEVDQAAFSGTIPSTADLVLGAWDGSILGYAKDHYFNGSLDDIRIYSTALSDSDVQTLYDNTYVAPLVGHWSFDNGDAVADIGSDGVNSGATFVTDAGRTAASFDGNDQISIPHGADNTFGTGDFTVSMWFNPDVVSYGVNGQGTLWSKDYTNLEIFLWEGEIKAYMGGAGNRMNGGNVSAGSWQHLVLTRTGTDVKMYINGADVGSVEAGSPGTANLSAGSNNVLLGLRAGNGATYYQGKMDDVRHYLAGLDASQVSDLYTATTVSDSEAPVITVVGDNPMSLEPGDTFTDPGATAVDNFDGAVSVVASGGDNINLSDDWEQHASQPMPTINGDGSLSYPNGVNIYAKKENAIDGSKDFEIVVEFDNNSVGAGDFSIILIDDTMPSNPPFVILRQQSYSAWGASNSFFFGVYNGTNAYSSSGAGPAQLTSGAMKISKFQNGYEFFSSSDKTNFTSMGSLQKGPFDPDNIRIVVQAGSRTVDVTGFSRNDISTGAQAGDYTITYTAQDAAGNVATAQRSITVAAAGGADFLHGLDVKHFFSTKTSNSSRSEAYIHKHNGQTRLSLSSKVSEAPSVHVDLGAVEAESLTTIFDGMIAVGLKDGDIKVVKIEDSSAEVTHTISDPSINGLSKVVKNGNHSGPGGSFVFFDNDGNIFFSPTIDANGSASGAITSPSINIPALAHGNKTHIVDAEAGAGVLVAITRNDDGGGKEMFVWDMSSENQIPLGNLPINDVWEINHMYNHLSNTYQWVIANAAGETASTSDILSWS